MDNRSRAATIRKVERRIRAKYRKRGWIVFFVALAIGIALGIFACSRGWVKVGSAAADPVAILNSTNAPNDAFATLPAATMPALLETPTPAPTEVPTPTPAPTEVPTPVPTDSNPLSAYFGSLNAMSPSTAAPTEAPTAAPTEAPTPEATQPDVSGAQTAPNAGEAAVPDQAVVQPQVAADDPSAKGGRDNPVLVTEPFSFQTQVLSDGTPRTNSSNANFDTVQLALTMDNYLTPAYFAEKYANSYKLTGFEAGTALTLKVESSTAATALSPQSALRITFESANGEENVGYQLMDAEIAGRYDVSILPGEIFKVYKRFAYSASPEMEFMVVTYYQDGQAHKIYYKLEVSVPAKEYVTLSKGSRGDDVKALQERLLALGYLSDAADGIFGGNTETAIRDAQTAAGYTPTGIADSAFQNYIFSETAIPKT